MGDPPRLGCSGQALAPLGMTRECYCPAYPLTRLPAYPLTRLLLFPTDAWIPQSLPVRLKFKDCTCVDSIQLAPPPQTQDPSL
jgi:hypothetical protein